MSVKLEDELIVRWLSIKENPSRFEFATRRQARAVWRDGAGSRHDRLKCSSGIQEGRETERQDIYVCANESRVE